MNVMDVMTPGLSHSQTISRPQRSKGTDRDGGADRAQELAGQNTPAVVVKISEQAQKALTASIANDADHGLDGK